MGSGALGIGSRGIGSFWLGSLAGRSGIDVGGSRDPVDWRNERSKVVFIDNKKYYFK